MWGLYYISCCSKKELRTGEGNDYERAFVIFLRKSLKNLVKFGRGNSSIREFGSLANVNS